MHAFSAIGWEVGGGVSMARRRHGCCTCGRRHLLASSAVALLPVSLLKPPGGTALSSDATDVTERFHPRRPDWYEGLFARAMNEDMRSYETQNVLELGVGTGPNCKYYAPMNAIKIVGVDPNKQMERYAWDVAIAAGIPSSDFSFSQGVRIEACFKTGWSILIQEHVVAQAGTFLWFPQTSLDPLQQFFADGCHPTKQTGKQISEASFTSVKP